MQVTTGRNTLSVKLESGYVFKFKPRRELGPTITKEDVLELFLEKTFLLERVGRSSIFLSFREKVNHEYDHLKLKTFKRINMEKYIDKHFWQHHIRETRDKNIIRTIIKEMLDVDHEEEKKRLERLVICK